MPASRGDWRASARAHWRSICGGDLHFHVEGQRTGVDLPRQPPPHYDHRGPVKRRNFRDDGDGNCDGSYKSIRDLVSENLQNRLL